MLDITKNSESSGGIDSEPLYEILSPKLIVYLEIYHQNFFRVGMKHPHRLQEKNENGR